MIWFLATIQLSNKTMVSNSSQTASSTNYSSEMHMHATSIPTKLLCCSSRCSRLTSLATCVLFCFLADPVQADVTDKRIDRRNATDATGNYFIIFCARKSAADKPGVGHAFVIWAQENHSGQYSTAQAFGFYPEGDKKLGLFGPVPGDLKNESTQRDPTKLQLITHRLTVQVNQKIWQESQSRIKQWNTSSYNLVHQNCVHFTYEVASDLGLVVDRRSAEYPSSFLSRLIESAK